MNSHILAYIDNTIAYIEQNIKGNISLENISKEAAISKFHLNRLFSAITGRTLMAYVNSRRLASSVNDLLHTNMRILDIACDYGFDFENSFIRAFKREFGITPAKFRQTRLELKLTPIIDKRNLTVTSKNSILVEPFLIVKPSFCVIGERCYVDESAYVNTTYLTDFANNFYDNKMPLIKNKIKEVYYGHIVYDGKYNFYTSCVETPEDEPVPDGLVKIQIPANKYRVFRYIGFHPYRKITFDDFSHIFKAVYKWFGMDMNNPPSGMYHLEKMDSRNCSESYCELDLYFPVQE